ncbi:hypothetical protein AMECASPLE_002491 [Ameca splendens]|uniref:Integrase core domain-containing protein n=1 Tax=Ameca splendens TaxID=208324 RepID=A0ABV1A5F0_9TELE
MRKADVISQLTRWAPHRNCLLRACWRGSIQEFSMLLISSHSTWITLSLYNIVIFGGIDGFSRKIMYLCGPNNNLSSTALAFFKQSVDTFGLPLRVRADHGVENVDIARLMFSVRGQEGQASLLGRACTIKESNVFGEMFGVQQLTYTTLCCIH